MIVDCSTNSNQSTVYLVNKLFFGAKTHFLPSITANLCLLLVPSIFSLSLLHRNITEIDRKQMTGNCIPKVRDIHSNYKEPTKNNNPNDKESHRKP